METLTIKLNIDGEEKKFTTPQFIKGQLFRRAADIAELMENGEIGEQDLDALYSFVSDVFNNEFTIIEFEDGTDARDIIRTVYAVVNYVMGNVAQAAELLGGKVSDEEGK